MNQLPDPSTLVSWVRDARRRTVAQVEDLSEAQLVGPKLAIVNPLGWEIGHAAWFHERWILRHGCQLAPLRPDGDDLWDSIAIPHAVRWDLPIPPLQETLSYVHAVEEKVCQRIISAQFNENDLYHALYAVFHDDMHTEAFAMTRQTLGYPRPSFATRETGEVEIVSGDADCAGGRFELGADRGAPFVFDNEKWAHEVELAPFSISRRPVNLGEFAQFVDDGGYSRSEHWSEAGWKWRCELGAQAPVYWRGSSENGWQVREFDSWWDLNPTRSVQHVSAYEAEAYAHWAGRRLPIEAEWEFAAKASGTAYPWGQSPPGAEHAALDGRSPGPAGSHPAGAGWDNSREWIGGVWEWTASAFLPYPGFEPDMYKEYSEPWFGGRRVLRGGSWLTSSRMIRTTWRNFHTPDRRDAFTGFRTCAL